MVAALAALLSLTLVACSDDAPTDSGSDGAGLSDGGGGTSVPGNEPGDGDGGGMNDEPDSGGDGTGEGTTGGSNPAGGTTGDPE
jgi:hypothetical protein